MKAFRFCCALVFVFAVSFFLPGCAAGNNTVTRTGAYPKTIEKAKRQQRQFIMHSGVDTFTVTSVLVERTKHQFTVHLQKLDTLHRVALPNPELATTKYVRLFMRDSTSYTLDEPHTIPLDRVLKMELVD